MAPRGSRATTSRDVEDDGPQDGDRQPPPRSRRAPSVAREVPDRESWTAHVHSQAEFHAGQRDAWSQESERLEDELHEARKQTEAHGMAAASLQEVISSFEGGQKAAFR